MIVRTSAVMCCRHVHRVRSSCFVAFALVLSTRSVDDASNNGEPCFGGEAGAGLDVDVRVFQVTRDQKPRRRSLLAVATVASMAMRRVRD